ncbi:MAG: hypothetical protein QM682_01970 [Paracoccus sp. (in: a-proteobacteria)]
MRIMIGPSACNPVPFGTKIADQPGQVGGLLFKAGKLGVQDAKLALGRTVISVQFGVDLGDFPERQPQGLRETYDPRCRDILLGEDLPGLTAPLRSGSRPEQLFTDIEAYRVLAQPGSPGELSNEHLLPPLTMDHDPAL